MGMISRKDAKNPKGKQRGEEDEATDADSETL